MRIRKLSVEPNIVSEIDDLIMELTYIKNSNTASIEKLNKGVEIIELILSLSDMPANKTTEEKLGYNTFHDGQHYYSGNYNIAEYKDELKDAKERILELMKNPKNADKVVIEKIQELLLKISIPIWKEEVSILKPKQSKCIEM